jgi:hemerythrin-like metal-binding protein
MNDALTWSDHYLLGYTPMDAVHQEFVDLVGQLQANPPDSQPAWAQALSRLHTHAQAHFGDENRWMVATDFPARQCHIDEHAAVLQSIEDVQAQVSDHNLSFCIPLVTELAHWFPGHADYLDSALAHWLCKRQLGGKPVVLRRDLKLGVTDEPLPLRGSIPA